MRPALLFLSFAASAFAQDAVDELHFGIEPDARVLAVTVVAHEQSLWRLWPDEVKLEPAKQEGRFTVSYSPTVSPYRLLQAAQSEGSISKSCKKEAALLLNPPARPVEEEKLTTTVYYELEEGTPRRIGLSATDGIRIVDARALRSEGEATVGKPVALEPWTRAVFARVSYYNLVGSGPVGISDIAIHGDPAKGSVQLATGRPGFGAASQLHRDGRISDACWAELSQTGWGTGGFSLKSLLFRRQTESVVVIPVTQKTANRISVRVGSGLSLKGIGTLD